MIGEVILEKKQWKYKIGGGVGCGTILVFIMTVGMAALCLWFHKTGNDAILLGRIILTMFAAAFVLSLYRTIFFKVLINKDGFYYQSAPGNGRYYRYSEIRRAWLSSGRETNSNTATYCKSRPWHLVKLPQRKTISGILLSVARCRALQGSGYWYVS